MGIPAAARFSLLVRFVSSRVGLRFGSARVGRKQSTSGSSQSMLWFFYQYVREVLLEAYKRKRYFDT